MTEQKASWKNKQFEILCSIDDICRENDIDMYLCDSTALKAYCEGELSDSIFVAIEPKDAYRFIKAVEEQSCYGIRGIFNYYHYPEFDFKVYDESTIDFNLATYRSFNFCGLYVTVKFIMHLPDEKRVRLSYLRDLDAFKQFISVRYDNIDVPMHRRLKLLLLLSKLTSGDKFHQKFFERSIARFSKPTKKVKVGEAICDASVFGKKSCATIDGREFYIPGDPATYFMCRYGNGWETRGVAPYEERNYRFRDGDHSWEEFKEYICYLDLDEYYSKRDISRANIEKNKKFEKRWQRDKYIVERTHLRFLFWLKYMPIKKDLLELHRSGKSDQLQDLLSPYLKELERFANSNLAIFFDEDIYNIAIDIFRSMGKEKISNKLHSIVPQEHRKELKIKNSRGEYIDDVPQY